MSAPRGAASRLGGQEALSEPGQRISGHTPNDFSLIESTQELGRVCVCLCQDTPFRIHDPGEGGKTQNPGVHTDSDSMPPLLRYICVCVCVCVNIYKSLK